MRGRKCRINIRLASAAAATNGQMRDASHPRSGVATTVAAVSVDLERNPKPYYGFVSAVYLFGSLGEIRRLLKHSKIFLFFFIEFMQEIK